MYHPCNCVCDESILQYWEHTSCTKGLVGTRKRQDWITDVNGTTFYKLLAEMELTLWTEICSQHAYEACCEQVPAVYFRLDTSRIFSVYKTGNSGKGSYTHRWLRLKSVIMLATSNEILCQERPMGREVKRKKRGTNWECIHCLQQLLHFLQFLQT